MASTNTKKKGQKNSELSQVVHSQKTQNICIKKIYL